MSEAEAGIVNAAEERNQDGAAQIVSEKRSP